MSKNFDKYCPMTRGHDLAMKQNQNSKERDADEWVELFTMADSRFKVVQITSPPQSALSIIEAVWESGN